MEKMKIECPKAHDWLEQMAPNTWVRAFSCELQKCNILLNSICEVYNSSNSQDYFLVIVLQLVTVIK